MNNDIISFNEILIENRLRLDHTDNDGIKESLRKFGTIQPIILEQLATPTPEGHRFRLIAGGRRSLFLQELGHTQLWHGSAYDPKRPGYVFGTELTSDDLHELEIEENIRRKAMSWQEKVLSIVEIHRLRIIRMGAEGESWGLRETGELLGISYGKIQYTIALASFLKSSPTHPLWSMESITDGVRWMLERKELEALAYQNKVMAEAATVVVAPPPPPTLTEIDYARQQYLSNPHNPPDEFDAYMAQRTAMLEETRQAKRLVPISTRLFHGNCLDLMFKLAGSFDHIITDPPYAIDMDNLNQTNLGLSNIASVEIEHQVTANYSMLQDFLNVAFDTMKSSGYLIMWADYSMWDYLWRSAEAIGFTVQRWPIVWVKTHTCMNSCAQYNFTKNTEIAIVMRKPSTTLVVSGPSGHIITGHDEFRRTMSHPFVKPFLCWKHLIEAVSLEGQTILDPFCGEGSSILSMIRLKRRFLGIELNSDHYNRLLENTRNEYLRLDPNSVFA